MLDRRAVQLNAEASSRQLSIWVNIYRIIHCPGYPCYLGPYCWIDPDSKKYYKLFRPYLENFVEYIEQGHMLQSYDNVPQDIREQLYAEVQQSLERCQKATSTSTANFPPINITNVLPAYSCQTPIGPSPAGTLAPDVTAGYS
jgi:hypothetical protein